MTLATLTARIAQTGRQLPRTVGRQHAVSSVTSVSCFPLNSNAPSPCFISHHPAVVRVGACYFFSSTPPSNEAGDDSKDQKSSQQQEDGTSIKFVDDMDALGNETKHAEDTLELDRSAYTVQVKVRMPNMGEGNENKVNKWYKQPGDIVKRNDILCDIETPDFTFG
jgi:hypothetical protein